MPDLATSVRLKFAVVESQQGFLPCGADFRQNRQAEIANALQTFPDIQHNPALLQLIAAHINLNPAALVDDERVLIYCEYQKLQSIRLEPWGNKYRVIKVSPENSSDNPSTPSQGWTSVDLNGIIMRLGVQTLAPVTSPPLRDLKPQPTPEPKITITAVSVPRLRYQVLDRLPDPRSCAPRTTMPEFDLRRQEIAAFPEIQNDHDTFTQIAQHLSLPPHAPLSDAQKLQVYREYARLNALTFYLLVAKYQFQSGPYIGLIDPAGTISLLRTLPASGCPR